MVAFSRATSQFLSSSSSTQPSQVKEMYTHEKECWKDTFLFLCIPLKLLTWKRCFCCTHLIQFSPYIVNVNVVDVLLLVVVRLNLLE